MSTAANTITPLLQTQNQTKKPKTVTWGQINASCNIQHLWLTFMRTCFTLVLVCIWSSWRHIWPAVFTFDEQVVSRQAAMTPARNGTVLLWGTVAVGRVLFCYFVIARATCHAIEIHAGNDGLGKRRGRWGGGRGRAIVVILTTHNGRLLHLQTTGVQAKRETENGDEWKWGQNNRCVKQYSC